ncbi:MAG: DUF6544 family protein [Gemmatimonadales bacterium]
MATGLRWGLVVLLAAHGLVHFLGAAKAFGVAELPQLTQPISRLGGAGWLAAGIAVLLTAALLAASSGAWLWVAPVAAVLSQAMIVFSWSDAKYGTVVNVVLVVAAAWAFATEGPWSLRAEYRREVEQRLTGDWPAAVVGADDVERLPEPVRRYLRATGAVGRPVPQHVRARWSGRIRGGPTDPWMSFEAEQHNFSAEPARLFMMDARRGGVPVHVLHRFVHGEATMRARALGMVTVAAGGGPEFTRAETVTLLNDFCLLAPGALVGRAFRWDAIDRGSARVTYALGAHTVSAVLTVNEAGDLVDFVSDDRAAMSKDGQQLLRQRWSTPILSHQSIGGTRAMLRAEGRWHPPEGDYAYIELDLVDLVQEPPADLG